MEKTAVFVTPLQLNQEAYASVRNPTITYMEFVFTDDKPNANKQGIKQSAFSNIISTGTLMPIKMSPGRISPGHKGTTPLGVIAALEEKSLQDESRNLVVGKAALWGRERPEDIDLIKQAFAAGEPLNISWEVLFSETEVDEQGIEWLVDPIVRAATFVGIPAYGGRTQLTSVASDETQEELDMDEVEKLTNELAAATAKSQELETEKQALASEVEGLRQFKAEVERVQAQAALWTARTAKLAEAGIEMKAEDLEAKREKFLKLDDEAFDLLVAELKGLKTETAEVHNETPIPGSVAGGQKLNRIEIVRAGLQALKETK